MFFTVPSEDQVVLPAGETFLSYDVQSFKDQNTTLIFGVLLTSAGRLMVLIADPDGVVAGDPTALVWSRVAAPLLNASETLKNAAITAYTARGADRRKVLLLTVYTDQERIFWRSWSHEGDSQMPWMLVAMPPTV